MFASNFFVFNAGTATPPYFELAQALGRGSEVMEQSALHCLHCFIRHSVNALAIRSMVQNKPVVKACQQCGCPEAVMIFDRDLAARDGAPHVLQRTDGVGRRIEHIYLWHDSDSPPAPEALHSTIEHISQGADTEGCRITASPAPPGHEDLHGLAQALVFHHEQEGVLSRDALSRTETMEVYVPDCGPVFMAVVTAPDRAG
ncbi:hypothetical protein [Streptomyces sp. NPDC127072]|uniref:hypothetical protein n=1 Tax=Streptomyces sp. NPDC127072 TaxID=3347129 RepID=UPI0036507B4E